MSDEKALIPNLQESSERKRLEEALRESEERQRFLLKLGDALRPLANPAEIQTVATRLLGEQLGANRVLFAEIGDDGLYSTIEDDYTVNTPSIAGRHRLSDFGPNFMAQLSAGQTLIIPDVATAELTESERAAYAAIEVGSLVGVPLIKQGRWVSALGVYKPDAYAWSAQEIWLIEYTAERTWSAVVRARAEKALQESEERYRSLFESIDEAFLFGEVIVNSEGKAVDYRILEVNPSYEQVVGLKRAEVIGKTAREILPTLDEKWVGIVGRVALQGEVLRFEGETQHIGKWFDFYFTPIGAKGSGKFVTVFQDISARKQAEETMRASEVRQSFLLRLGDTVRSLADVAAILSEATRLLGEHLGANRAFYAEVDADAENFMVEHDFSTESTTMTGRRSISDFGTFLAIHVLRGQTLTISDVATAGLSDAERTAFAAINVGSAVVVPLIKEGRLVSALAVTKGEAYPWRADEVRLVEETAERTWSAVVRARAELALHRLNEELESRVAERTAQVSSLVTQLTISEQEERRRISSILHDDLQQRLFSILLQFQILREIFKGADTEERDAAVAQMEGEIQEVVQVTRDLSVDLSPPILYDEGLLETVQWLANRMMRQYGLEVKITVKRKLPPLPENLRLLLFQVVRELLFNVVKHAGVKQAEVKFSHYQGNVRIEVSDKGKGFDRKVGNGNARYGQGLQRMHQRLKLLGGHLKIVSKPGRGTHIVLYVPLHDTPLHNTPLQNVPLQNAPLQGNQEVTA